MARMMIIVSEEEGKALHALAKSEFRDSRLQAALIIRKELEGLGLIETANLSEPMDPITRPVLKGQGQTKIQTTTQI